MVRQIRGTNFGLRHFQANWVTVCIFGLLVNGNGTPGQSAERAVIQYAQQRPRQDFCFHWKISVPMIIARIGSASISARTMLSAEAMTPM